ncbi:MAG: hypothetical protein DLM60_14560 [Pseudonocardiales bacterium]|nr:ribbon-helix-helix domain-containing protein [Actinomycetota bacterium]PZS16919.1 MAG: hypothetical protein DLM60_14560 [Pseudonocardiales bacterium]
MLRTQISLTEEQKRRLDTLSAERGLSLSELVRQAVERCYGESRDAEQDLRRLRVGFGAWVDQDQADQNEAGEEYVARLRSGSRLAGR